MNVPGCDQDLRLQEACKDTKQFAPLTKPALPLVSRMQNYSKSSLLRDFIFAPCRKAQGGENQRNAQHS